MKLQEKLIKLMEEKHKAIIQAIGENPYFTEEDRQELESWPDDVAKKVWSRIVFQVVSNPYDYIVFGLRDIVCPWCIRHGYPLKYGNPCGKCGYGRRHGYCYMKSSDYNQIILKVAETKKTILPREKYLEIIEQIEESTEDDEYQRSKGVK